MGREAVVSVMAIDTGMHVVRHIPHSAARDVVTCSGDRRCCECQDSNVADGCGRSFCLECGSIGLDPGQIGHIGQQALEPVPGAVLDSIRRGVERGLDGDHWSQMDQLWLPWWASEGEDRAALLEGDAFEDRDAERAGCASLKLSAFVAGFDRYFRELSVLIRPYGRVSLGAELDGIIHNRGDDLLYRTEHVYEKWVEFENIDGYKWTSSSWMPKGTRWAYWEGWTEARSLACRLAGLNADWPER